jgi:uncharacterized protein (TIGR02444 family)
MKVTGEIVVDVPRHQPADIRQVNMAEHLDTPMWNFSVAIYGRDGVQAECLDAQDRLGLDVNILLFCAYAGAIERVALREKDLKAAVAVVKNWQTDVLGGLRGARRALKSWGAGEDAVALDAAALRGQVKEMELTAEKIEQFMLWTWLHERLAALPRKDPRQALADNLRLALSLSGAGVDAAAALPHLLKAAGSTVQSTPG